MKVSRFSNNLSKNVGMLPNKKTKANEKQLLVDMAIQWGIKSMN